MIAITDMTSGSSTARQAIRKYNILGFALVIILFGGFGGWASTMDISGAVIAPGSIVVESSVKKVQHPSGGVVQEILIKEGEKVQSGQVLIRLNKTLPKASLGIVASARDELLARQGRLLAERDGQPQITFAAELLSTGDAAAAAMAGETKLFQSRRLAKEGEKKQLREQITQSNEEISGLSAQLAAKEQELGYIVEELKGVEDLYKKQLVTVVRYNQLQRDKARLSGERGNIVAAIARAKAQISESEIKILQTDEKFRTEVLKDLREAEGRLAETREKVIAADDQFERTEIRAPQSGVVHQLQIHTIGAVISQGETLMEIVPGADQLVFEGKVQPHDIDQIDVGAKVHLRVMAGNQRTTPEYEAVLDRKAADLTTEQKSGTSYYVIRATLDPDQDKKPGALKLVPGMPAEAFVHTQDRTTLQYLLKPLNDQIARTFRER